MKKYKDYHQNQVTFLPPSLDQLIAPNHLVRVVDKFVSQLSSKIWEHVFTGGGAPAYPPRMMMKIILYAYSCKIFTSRPIAKAVRQDVTFMWLAGLEQPDFNTINRFRSKYFNGVLDEVFAQLLDYLREKKYVTFADFFVDGSKFEADAGKFTYVWKKNTERYKQAVLERVQKLFVEIEELNLEEDKKYGDSDLPECGESADVTSEEIKEVAQNISDKLTEITGKKQKRQIQSKLNKLSKEAYQLEKYEQQEEILGDRNSYSKTDTGSTFMRMKDDRLRAAYNLQISTENQFIMNYSASQNASDTASFADHLEKIVERGEKYLPDNYMGDSAYGSEENSVLLEKNKINNFLKYNTFHQDEKGKKSKNPYHRDKFVYNKKDDNFKCPQGQLLLYKETIERKSKTNFVSTIRVYEYENCNACPVKSKCTEAKDNRQVYYNTTLEAYKEQMRENLSSEKGKELRKRRGFEVETPFGDFKRNCSFSRFHLRGLPKVEHEIGLLCIAYNLRKIYFKELKKAA
ncbi:MAG: IS1182 family transposase [Bacteroidales bacterium]|nr:IS1182 family transposase [Bacteroidales bacterium]